MGFVRDTMKADLELRGYAKSTQDHYLRQARRFAAHYMKDPRHMGEDEVRRYLLYLVRVQKSGPHVHKMSVAALKFLYGVTLDRPEVAAKIPWPRVPSTVPEILSGREVERLLEALGNLKYRALVMTLYGTGLRISEACRLEVSDIDSQRMLLRVRRGKGQRGRYVMLPERLLRCLREYWRLTRPASYLFPGAGSKPISPDAVRGALKKAAKRAGITKNVSPHGLRHAFATHLIEGGIGIRVVQVLLGHRSITTTEHYTQISRGHVGQVRSPLDVLGTEEARRLG